MPQPRLPQKRSTAARNHHKPHIESPTTNLMISEGNAWHFDKNITMLAQTPPFSDVIIINHALAHNYGPPLHIFRQSIH